MNRLYRIVIVLIIAIALLLPSKALAEPGQTLPYTTKYVASSAEFFFKRGVYEVLIEDYNSAIKNFSQAINLNPNNAQAYSNQGLARAALGDQQGAIKDFNQALHLDPKLVTAYYNRGFVHFRWQDHQAAIKDFNQAIEFDPSYADAYHCRCLVRNLQGDKQGVIKDFQKAATLYLQQGKLEQYKVLLKNIADIEITTVN